jgi:DNA-binding response OmpR family regulator
MNAPIRVLYVEDDARDADLMQSRLADDAPEFDVHVVATGQECLRRVQEAGFDLVLLDHRLPDMDGLSVLRSLAESGSHPPVVMVTGLGDNDLAVKALRLGAVNYLPKRGRYLDTLPDLLRSVLREHRQAQRNGRLGSVAGRRILYVEHLPMSRWRAAAPRR